MEQLDGHLADSQGQPTTVAHVIQGAGCQQSVYAANICQGAGCQQVTMRQPEGDSNLSQDSCLSHQSIECLHPKKNIPLLQNATSVFD